MDHPFTPPARIPAFLPKPKTPNTVKKSKAEYFGTLPAKLDAHLTEEELQQLTRNSMEAAHPIISGSHSRSSRSPRSSVNYDRRYGRSGSVSSMLVTQAPRKLTGAAGLTVLDLMQAQHSSSNNFPASYPHTQDIPHLTGLDVQLPSGSPSGSISLATFDNKGRDLKYYHDGPSPPVSAPTFIPRGSSKHLTGAALHLPQDEVPASVAHPIGADLKLPDDGGPVIQSPFTVALNHFDELEESTFIAALLLEKMDSKPSTPIDKLPIDDSSAPTPPSPPVRKYSAKSVSTESSESVIITPTTTTTMVYKMIPPPSVVALTSNLGSRGEPSSDLNRSLPAKTPVYTFIPPPPISSPITSDLDASIPSNIPSPIGSSVTATQQPQMNSFIPPPHTVPIGSPATQIQELLDNFSITTPQSVSRIASPAVEPYSKPSAYMPPSMATHYRESSAVARAEGTCDKAANPGGNTIQRSNSGRAVPGALCEAIAGFNRAFNGQGRPQTPIELSAVSNAAVQSPISQVPAPVHGSTSNTLQKPQPVMALPDAALSPQPPFRNKSQLNHSPNLHQNPIMSGQPPGAYLKQPNIYLRNTIDRQLPANAPSLHIETVPSFPRPVAKEASFWRRRKKALTILLVIVLLGIGVGIVFVAHSFYRRWGGVGFLKKRGVEGLNKKREYVQAERGDVWGHQNKKGRDGKKGGHGKGKGLLESMLVGGYKRGWSIDYKDGKNCKLLVFILWLTFKQRIVNARQKSQRSFHMLSGLFR